MATPPRRWVGYALLTAGFSLLFDTYTFLRTDWSPLRVPMYPADELALGYVLVVSALLLLAAPILFRALDTAPDDSMTIGEDLAYESVELRRQRRLPLRRRFATFPNRGLVASAILLLLPLAFLMVTQQDPSKGIYVRLTPQYRGQDKRCLEDAIIITVKHDPLSQMFLNGKEVSPEELERALKPKLALQANWEVLVEGDDSVLFADWVAALDVIRALHAKAVVLTPALRRQMADGCTPRVGARIRIESQGDPGRKAADKRKKQTR